MSDSTYDHYGNSGPMPQQPQFKDCVWESAKDPLNTFRTWLCIFGGIAANYGHGVWPQPEWFLDLFLLRDPQAATTQPSFLNDPRLSLGDELMNGLMGPFEVQSSLGINRHSHRVIMVVLVLRVIHWGVKHVLLPPSTMMTSTAL